MSDEVTLMDIGTNYSDEPFDDVVETGDFDEQGQSVGDIESDTDFLIFLTFSF